MESPAVVPMHALAPEVRWATRPIDKLRGLLAGPPLGAGEALIIVGARQVHSVGMSYPLDVVFCDREGVVLHKCTLGPNRITRWVPRARFAIECRAGAAAPIQIGDRLALTDGSPIAE